MAAVRPAMVFDWDRAAWLIREFKATYASAGLAGDWEYTGGPILEDGRPVDPEYTSAWLVSNWEEPQLLLEGEAIPCWRLLDHAPDWDEGTYWPDSARAILAGEAPSPPPCPTGT
jgi:hypothetical protein